MTQKAIFIFEGSKADYADFGFIALSVIKESYQYVSLICHEGIADFVNEMKGFNELLPIDFSHEQMVIAYKTAHTQDSSYFNLSTRNEALGLTGALKQAGHPIYGFYFENGLPSGSSPFWEEEIYFQRHGFLPDNSTRKDLSRRQRALQILNLGSPQIYYPGIDRDEVKPQSIGLDCGWEINHYSQKHELKKLLERKGYELIEFHPEESWEALTGKFNTISKLISVDGLVSRVAENIGIPVIGLSGPVSLEVSQFKNYVHSKQACNGCQLNKCLQNKNSCLDDISPRRILYALEKQTPVTIDRQIVKNWLGKKVHVFCYHGLGDAIRFALPVAIGLARAGASVVLHVRYSLLTCIGEQEELLTVAGIDPGYISECESPEKAFDNIMEHFPDTEIVIGLGSSYFEQLIPQFTQSRGIEYWGTNCPEDTENYATAHFWNKTLERYKCRELLFSMIGIPEIDKNEILLNPDERLKPTTVSEDLVGLHATAMWDARCYEQWPRLKSLLEEDYKVWNFDASPCNSLGELAWWIKSSKAVLTVDTMVAHLCTALQVPALVMNGPVWHHKENIPNPIGFTITTPYPEDNQFIDKESKALSQIDPERIASEFKSFVAQITQVDYAVQ